ncbi:MAG: zinc ribbon domain-containing protein [Prevotella sp.]|nr:zinc ribbon domain-containing protein [Prevotella sp.]
MNNDEQTSTTAEKFVQITKAGNLVVLDPLTLTETFFTANETHDRFTNPKGEELTAEEILIAVNERLRQAFEQLMAEQNSEATATGGDRFCQYCGKPLVEGDSFCRHCGKKIE